MIILCHCNFIIDKIESENLMFLIHIKHTMDSLEELIANLVEDKNVENEVKDKIVKIEYDNKRIEDISEKDLIRMLSFNSMDDVIERQQYRGFELIVNGRVYNEDRKPIVVSFYNGYIRYIGADNEENIEDKKAKMNAIFSKDEVEELVHYGWTGGFENAIGFDCAHAGDVNVNLCVFKVMGMSAEDTANTDFVDLYSVNDSGLYRDEDTFKSREYLFEMLGKVADKSLEIYESEYGIA